MNSNFYLSETEQNTLDAARRLLGVNLADYLLSGLGETRVTYCRAFTSRSPSRRSERAAYQLEMINESDEGLPMGRDPLVLAAILALLWQHQSLKSTSRFYEVELIESLMWPHNSEAKSWVKSAIERYLLTAFYLVDPTATEGERVFGRYARYRRLLVGYETTRVGVRRGASHWKTQLMFLPELIECVESREKRFLGIEFHRLRGMRRIDSEEDAKNVR